MNREEKLLSSIDRSMRILELGPLTSPIAPRSEGWEATVVDHMSRDNLVAKYAPDPSVETARIVDVDIVWSHGPLDAAVPADLHGTYDAFIASHVFEHIPDPIGLLRSLERVLRPTGVVSLAIPDKRFCFDFFKPLSSVGALLEAHAVSATRHSRAALFNDLAYNIRADGEISFSRRPVRDIEFVHSIDAAKRAFDDFAVGADAPYVDLHGWQFTPSSFQLAILELCAMGVTDYAVERVFPTEGVEFHVTLRRGCIQFAGEQDLNVRRLELLRQTLLELGEQAALLTPDRMRRLGRLRKRA